ncbi:dihydrodipicolinate synthase family protein [Streptomyces sp. WMMB 322]|uniref:dihydrodipicolinate synthase family protein n=1 Tax=Streptomyces sp. WMMB 322 TaxID=1286821 RepID=UPI000823D2AA|nr:dihydrodipicolinate synthase family protein [Streptomyces sp. WMMB 322]SCK16782.1 4-hydroxy-tetrahydrodipicolinate synthase [Streptomyces sp. WMMB 322]
MTPSANSRTAGTGTAAGTAPGTAPGTAADATADPAAPRGPLTGGVVPPLVTPLTEDRALDVPSFERLIGRLLEAGVDGLFVLGSTGEAAFCTDELRAQVISEAVRVTAGRVPVLAGVIDTQTGRVLRQLEAARQAGAEGVVATAPFYAATHAPQVRRHFEILGERADVPVYAYDIPACVHTKLDPDMLVELGLSGAIAGVKDSSGDDVAFRRLALRNRDEGGPLTLFTGHEAVVDGAYLAGADGVVPGLANVDPDGYVRMHAAFRRGDWTAVRGEQDRLAALMEITRVATSVTGWGAGVGAFKTALMLQGVIAHNQLPQPFEAFGGDDAEAVRAVLGTAGLLPPSPAPLRPPLP